MGQSFTFPLTFDGAPTSDFRVPGTTTGGGDNGASSTSTVADPPSNHSVCRDRLQHNPGRRSTSSPSRWGHPRRFRTTSTRPTRRRRQSATQPETARSSTTTGRSARSQPRPCRSPSVPETGGQTIDFQVSLPVTCARVPRDQCRLRRSLLLSAQRARLHGHATGQRSTVGDADVRPGHEHRGRPGEGEGRRALRHRPQLQRHLLEPSGRHVRRRRSQSSRWTGTITETDSAAADGDLPVHGRNGQRGRDGELPDPPRRYAAGDDAGRVGRLHDG